MTLHDSLVLQSTIHARCHLEVNGHLCARLQLLFTRLDFIPVVVFCSSLYKLVTVSSGEECADAKVLWMEKLETVRKQDMLHCISFLRVFLISSSWELPAPVGISNIFTLLYCICLMTNVVSPVLPLIQPQLGLAQVTQLLSAPVSSSCNLIPLTCFLFS